MTLHDLFVEYGTNSIKELINTYSNHIDWYTEMLNDDPWNTVAQSNLDFTRLVLDKLEIIDNLLHKNGSDSDIDLPMLATHLGLA